MRSWFEYSEFIPTYSRQVPWKMAWVLWEQVPWKQVPWQQAPWQQVPWEQVPWMGAKVDWAVRSKVPVVKRGARSEWGSWCDNHPHHLRSQICQISLRVAHRPDQHTRIVSAFPCTSSVNARLFASSPSRHFYAQGLRSTEGYQVGRLWAGRSWRVDDDRSVGCGSACRRWMCGIECHDNFETLFDLSAEGVEYLR